MHPQPRGWPADDRRRLGNLVLVVGEDVVLAAGVDVERPAEVTESHRRAFEVPAREALAPAAGPVQLAAGIGRLPQGEVRRILLVRLDLPLGAMARTQGIERVARQRSVRGVRHDRVVQVARRTQVGVAQVLQALGEQEHLGDVLGGARVLVRGQDVHGCGIGVERGLVGVRDLE